MITERQTEVEAKQAELEQAQTERANLKMLQIQEKQRIDAKISQLTQSIENSRDYFKNKFKIGFEAIDHEIQRKKAQSEELRRELKKEDIFIEYKSLFALEYQRKRLLTQIRPDGTEILNSVKKSHLDRITDDDFKRILREITPFQAKMLIDMREHVRTQSRAFYRER